MLKRDITYEDFNGDTVTETFYFNISKPELIELQVEFDEGFDKILEKIVKTTDNQGLIREFKRIILMAYGQKSEDGKQFVKSSELREQFSHTAAFQTLFMELAQKDDAAAIFIKGILPKDMRGDLDKAMKEADASTPKSSLPAPPTPPAKTDAS